MRDPQNLWYKKLGVINRVRLRPFEKVFIVEKNFGYQGVVLAKQLRFDMCLFYKGANTDRT